METEKRLIEALAPIPIEIVDSDYKDFRFDYDENGNIIYIGKNENLDASEDDPTWVLLKFFYDENGNITEIKIKIGAWSQRETLF